MKRGGILTGTLLGLLCLMMLVVAGLGVAGWYVAHDIRVTSSGDRVSVETPFGSLRVRENRAFNPKHFGIPLYPGAQPCRDAKSASVEVDFDSAHSGLTVLAAEYTTPDSVEKVRDYYRQELPSWLITERHHCIQIESGHGADKRIVCIRQRRGLTRIALASLGGAAAN